MICHHHLKKLFLCSVLVTFSHAFRVNTNSHRSGATDSLTLQPKPLVVNKASVPMVVYLERGFLFNKQVIQPGEAVNLWTPNYGPHVLPFSIVALVGSDVPTNFDSLRNFIGMSAVPAAFIGGTVVSIISWGALTGPAAALTPLVSKIALAGYTLGAVDIAAGVAAAGGAEQVAQMIIKEHPKAFMTKVRHVLPGTKYFQITGGPQANGDVQDLEIEELAQGQYMLYNVTTVKNCVGVSSQQRVKKVAFTIDSCGDGRAKGEWQQVGVHNDRPKYKHVDDENMKIRWSNKRKQWRMLYGKGRWHSSVLYKSTQDQGVVPSYHWEVVDAGLPVPTVELAGNNTMESMMTTPEVDEDAEEDESNSDSEDGSD